MEQAPTTNMDRVDANGQPAEFMYNVERAEHISDGGITLMSTSRVVDSFDNETAANTRAQELNASDGCVTSNGWSDGPPDGISFEVQRVRRILSAEVVKGLVEVVDEPYHTDSVD